MIGKYDGLNALVLGAGLSGEWAARLLLARGGKAIVLDEGDGVKSADAAARIRSAGGAVRFGKGDLPDDAFDVCVVSPAFALGHPWIAACMERGIPVISELELGAHYWRGKILAVTGSKGKSSFVKLCADTLGQVVSASPAGNYGIPLCRLALEQPGLQWAVTEVSSFQMEHSPTFHPHIAVLLNLQPDHLDRHGSMAEYRALKMRMFANMSRRYLNNSDSHSFFYRRELALFPAGFDVDPAIFKNTDCLFFGDTPGCDWYYVPSAVRFRSYRGVGPFSKYGNYSIAGSWFDNDVLGPAAAAGVAALLQAGLPAHAVKQGFKTFQPLPHRMQQIAADRRGTRFVDDSKATSLSALAAALKMAKAPVRLIAGGVLKEKELGGVKELLTRTTEKVYLIGDCAEQMFQAWSASVPCEVCGALDQAVTSAVRESQPGETVLLSPGAASLDQFTSYRERGERFGELVRAVADL